MSMAEPDPPVYDTINTFRHRQKFLFHRREFHQGDLAELNELCNVETA